jgi:hypothetical protein
MVEVECICCGAELSDQRSYQRPLMSAMCGACIREVELAQQAGRIIEQHGHAGVSH